MSNQKDTSQSRKRSALNPLAPDFTHTPPNAQSPSSDVSPPKPYMPTAAAPTTLRSNMRGDTTPMQGGIQQRQPLHQIIAPPVLHPYIPTVVTPNTQHDGYRAYSTPVRDNVMQLLPQSAQTGPRFHQQHRGQRQGPQPLSRGITNPEVQSDYLRQQGKPCSNQRSLFYSLKHYFANAAHPSVPGTHYRSQNSPLGPRDQPFSFQGILLYRTFGIIVAR
jgi:hypothetical protein